MADKLTLVYLNECFILTDDGKLIWKSRPRHHFNTDKGYKIFNTRSANKDAGGIDPRGYATVWIKSFDVNRLYKIHRIVYAMRQGVDMCDVPEILDHIDGDKGNNSPTNIRPATHSENQKNSNKYANNKSGFKGVSWHKASRKWASQIKNNGKTRHLGLFSDPNDAHKAYCIAARSLHKDFARV
jgi:hypothetical protein